VTSWFIFHPFALHLYFLYPYTVGSASFEFEGILLCYALFIFYYAFYFNYGLFFLCELNFINI
jgi:hypothetical protein